MAGWEDAGGWSFNESAYPTIPAAAQGSRKKAKKSAKNILHVSEADLLRPVRLAPGGQGAALGNPALKKRKGPSTEDAAAAGQKQAKKHKRDAVHAGGDGTEQQPPAQKGKLKEKRKQEHRQQQQQPKPKPKPKQQQDQHSGQQLAREPGKQKQKQQSQPQPQQQVAGPANASRAPDAAASTGQVDTGANHLAQRLTNGSQQKKSKKKDKKQRQQGDAALLSPPGEQQPPAASGPDRSAAPAVGASTHQTSNRSKQPADNAAAQVTGTTKRSKHSKQAPAAPAAAAAASVAPAPSAAGPADADPDPGSTDGGTAPSMLARLQGGAGGRGGSKLLEKMRQRLQGGAFRHLNELLYTSSSDTAFEEMQKDPSMFQQYHEGFQSQTRGWPMQPVQVAIDWLKRRPAEWVVADFGCGDALLGRSVPQTVHSLDLVASAPGVIACNMAHTPLEAALLDAAVFCLSLMGTDYGSFLVEACRLLKPNGWLWIAEVRSRFAAEGSKDCLKPLVRALARLGFVLDKSDTSNSHFVIMVLRKKGQPAGGPISWPPLKACLYKRR